MIIYTPNGGRKGEERPPLFFLQREICGPVKSSCREFLGAKVEENQRLGGGVSNVSFGPIW